MSSSRVPPDGGWGWVIVFAYALSQFTVGPIMASFGLLFKDAFNDFGFSATDTSTIINTNAGFTMISGFISGPLLKYLGYRKVAVGGAIFSSLGLMLTAYASTFMQFMVTYALITSLGVGMTLSAYVYALNVYFKKRRNYAAGIATTFQALGPVLMPQLIGLLLYLYDVKGATMILSGVASHAFIAAMLLQPVEWHLVKQKTEHVEEAYDLDKANDKCYSLQPTDLSIEKETNGNNNKVDTFGQSSLSIDSDLEVQVIYGIDSPLEGSILSLSSDHKYCVVRQTSNVSNDGIKYTPNESLSDKTKRLDEKTTLIPKMEEKQKVGESHDQNNSFCQRMLQMLVKMFDLDLLKDPIFVNIMVGLSLAVFAELSFSVLTPFIMADFDLSIQQIATFLSTLSIADLCFRFLGPFIGDFLKKPPRIMYMFSLLLLITTRFTLLLFSQYEHLLIVAFLLGVAKGVRTVFWYLVIPSYVPIEKLPNALGLQMIVNGVFILIGGPAIGVIRDITGSYKKCIVALNAVTLVTFVMWSLELIYLRCRRKKGLDKM